ncbi:hypothetical protein [Agromyces allii]|jgi:hypothetical protein|uniref:FtsX-like permease family protein n=1 Tax=Agromyces allii TaxID=393607 RepID=A0ABP5BWI1_9MICO|nr:hypothetical protein [Agromyces allii]
MKLRAIASEAGRNVRSGATRAVTWALIVLLIGLGTLLADTYQAVRIVQSAYAFNASGASVLTLQTDGTVDPGRCLALETVEGVESAMALRFTETTLRPMALPEGPLPIVEIAGDPVAFLDGSPDPVNVSGILLSTEVAEQLGMEGADALELESGERVAIRGTYPFADDGRDGRLASSALSVVPPAGHFDECWIRVWPYEYAAVDLLAFTADPAPEGASLPQAAQLNMTLGTAPEFQQEFSHRITRMAAALGPLAIALVGFAALWARRLELSTAMQLGVRKRELVLQMQLETLTWAAPVCWLLLAGGFVLLNHAVLSEDQPALFAGLASQVGAALICALSGAAAGVLCVRPTLQYRYLKAR